MFCWMTIPSVDLSYTLLNKGLSYPTRSKHQVRFVLYAFIGWGVGIFLMIGHLPLQKTMPVESDFNPGIGDNDCFISTEGNKLLYLFHLPFLLTMIFNISIYIVIVTQTKLKTKEAKASIR